MTCVDSKYSMLVQELEEARKDLDEVINSIHIIFDERLDLRDNPNDENSKRELELEELDNKLHEKESELYAKIREIANKIYWMIPPIKTNGIIEIKKQLSDSLNNSENIKCDYSVCLAKEKIVVGKISFRGYHCSSYIGDVGYVIEKEYRGHGYAYQAICLLSEYLKENGIDDVWISTYCSNTPSVKTIEKFGGVPIKSDGIVVLYQAPTFIMKKECEGSTRS